MVDAFWIEKCPSLKHVGFKVFSDKQLDFLKSLCDSERDEDASELLRNICGRDEEERKSRDCYLSSLILEFYKAAHWIQLAIDVCNVHRTHLTIGKDISVWGNIWTGVQSLEVWYQIKEGLAVWKDDVDELLPEVKDENEEEKMMKNTFVGKF